MRSPASASASSNSSTPAKPPRLVLTTIQALLQPVPDRAEFAARRRILRRGETADLEELAAWLVEHGYQNTDAVELPGEFSRRGGILDVLLARRRGAASAGVLRRRDRLHPPVFAGKRSAASATSDRAEWAAIGKRRMQKAEADRQTGHLGDYLPEDAWIVLVEAADLQRAGPALSRPHHRREKSVFRRGRLRTAGALPERDGVRAAQPVGGGDVPSARRVGRALQRRREQGARRAGRRGGARARDDRLPQRRGMQAPERSAGGRPAGADRPAAPGRRPGAGRLPPGWTRYGVVGAGRAGTVPPRRAARRRAADVPRRRLESRAIDSFLDLAEGDLVVHLSHGIARYRGMQVLEKNAADSGRDGAAAVRRRSI